MKSKPWQNKGYHKQRNICNSDVNIGFWSLINMMNRKKEMSMETKTTNTTVETVMFYSL